VIEACTGSAAACPADGFVFAGTSCRAAAGVCDVGETCTGAAPGCPADGFFANGTLCRAAAQPCDIADNCTGASAACPADAFFPNGTAMPACVGPVNATVFDCQSTTCHITTCSATWYDIDSSYPDGCECQDDGSSQVCGSATSLGSVAIGGTAAYSGHIMPGQEDYFFVDFPSGGRPFGGTPTVTVTGGAMLMDITPDCVANTSCPDNGGNSHGITGFNQVDNQSVGYTVNGVPFYTRLYIGVRRTSTAGTCGAAAYTVNVSRP
jgi:hypothetical protein